MNPLTCKKVALLLGVSDRRVRALAKDRGVGTKHGWSWLFKENDVELLRPGKVGRPKKKE
jgi:hypothetical protein